MGGGKGKGEEGCEGLSDEKKVEEEKAKPMVFALMRNGHEVIRGLGVDLNEAAEKKDLETFTKTWKTLSKWIKIHANMEDGVEGKSKGFFTALDEKFDGIVQEAGLRNTHEEIDKLEHDVDAAIDSGDIDKVVEAWSKFYEENEKHLAGEEKVMMPKVKAMKEA